MNTAKKLNNDADIYQAIAMIQDRDECKAFLQDLCTPAELESFEERWAIANILYEGDASYRDISAKTGASTTTIGRVARFLQKESNLGYQRIIKRIRGA